MHDEPIRVLLIEDDDDDYVLAQEMFRELPRGAYHLDRVDSFDRALQALDNCSHDLYLVDYRLGKRTGLELLEEARRRGCEAPLIMLTGQREIEIDMLAMQAGAVDYLLKDRLDAPLLERSMRYALQQQRHQMELEERVRGRTAELDELNRTLRIEISDRQRAEDAVREASRRKDEFLATMAHELRNPLAAIRSALELLDPLPDDLSEVQELHATMGRQLEQLRRLIEDLLDISRISRGKLTLRRDWFVLAEATQIALDMARPLIDKGGHELTVHLPADVIRLFADRVRVAQVIGNLLVNAAKYTPQGGKIRLAVRVEDGQAVIDVIDNGVGVPAEMLPRIFDLFTQVDSSKTRSHGGLGIGLTLVKALVDMHGGGVEACSEGPGLGSRFTVRLPLAEPAPAGFLQEEPINDAEIPELPVRRILIVDDNLSAAYLLKRLLERLGQEVHTTNSASDALAQFPRLSPAVVISDIGMPDISGYELAQAIRKRTDIDQPALIALTGYGNDTDRRAALDAGFNYHLCKPVSLHTLAGVLQEIAAQPQMPQ